MLLPDTLYPRDREAALAGRWADISPYGLNQLIDFATNAQAELQALLINANGEIFARPSRLAAASLEARANEFAGRDWNAWAKEQVTSLSESPKVTTLSAGGEPHG